MKIRATLHNTLVFDFSRCLDGRGFVVQAPKGVCLEWQKTQDAWDAMQREAIAAWKGDLKLCPYCEEAWLSVCGQDLECPACHAAYTQDMKMIEGVRE